MNLFRALDDLGILPDAGAAIHELGENKIISLFEEMLVKVSTSEAQAWRMYYGIGCEKKTLDAIAKSFTPPIARPLVKKWIMRTQTLLKHPLRINILLQALGRESLPVPDEEAITKYLGVESHSLSSVGLKTRLITILETGGVCTLPELLMRTSRQVRYGVKGFGDVTFARLLEALHAKGFNLKQG